MKKKKKIAKKMADDVCNCVITKDEIKKFPILAKRFPNSFYNCIIQKFTSLTSVSALIYFAVAK